VLWRAGLPIAEALALSKTDLDLGRRSTVSVETPKAASPGVI
jgi:hypothetical protein